jgi:hypothetical protein
VRYKKVPRRHSKQAQKIEGRRGGKWVGEEGFFSKLYLVRIMFSFLSILRMNSTMLILRTEKCNSKLSISSIPLLWKCYTSISIQVLTSQLLKMLNYSQKSGVDDFGQIIIHTDTQNLLRCYFLKKGL